MQLIIDMKWSLSDARKCIETSANISVPLRPSHLHYMVNFMMAMETLWTPETQFVMMKLRASQRKTAHVQAARKLHKSSLRLVAGVWVHWDWPSHFLPPSPFQCCMPGFRPAKDTCLGLHDNWLIQNVAGILAESLAGNRLCNIQMMLTWSVAQACSSPPSAQTSKAALTNFMTCRCKSCRYILSKRNNWSV